MANGKWQMANGKWQMANGKWQMANGKERKIKNIATTSYFSHDGKLFSGQEFMDQLFVDLGDLVKGEDELREIWSNPETRVQFLKVLSDKGDLKSIKIGTRRLTKIEAIHDWLASYQTDAE